VGTDLVRAEDPHPIVTFFTPREFAGMVAGRGRSERLAVGNARLSVERTDRCDSC